MLNARVLNARKFFFPKWNKNEENFQWNYGQFGVFHSHVYCSFLITFYIYLRFSFLIFLFIYLFRDLVNLCLCQPQQLVQHDVHNLFASIHRVNINSILKQIILALINSNQETLRIRKVIKKQRSYCFFFSQFMNSVCNGYNGEWHK